MNENNISKEKTKKVIVAHPFRQHSFNVATALEQENMLLAYCTTVYDHPHPGIRMMYTMIHYYYWLIRLCGENEDTLTILKNGCHAVIAYEKEVIETQKLRQCYFSVASTSKGVQHIMHLHNEWKNLVKHYNCYAYIPIETMENIDGMMASLNMNGSFIGQQGMSEIDLE